MVRLSLVTTKTSRWSLLSLTVALNAAGCLAEAPPPDNPPTAIGVLRAPSELGADFQWRQQVTAQWPTGTRTFDAVLSKEGSTLLLVGLGPMDTPGFILRVDSAGTLTVENNTNQPMPFDAKFVLLDVQRAYYPWFGSPLDAGVRTTTLNGESVTETWREGRLRTRRFERLDGQPKGVIEVAYEGWESGNRAPRRATLKNGWHGYTLVIETLDQTNLP